MTLEEVKFIYLFFLYVSFPVMGNDVLEVLPVLKELDPGYGQMRDKILPVPFHPDLMQMIKNTLRQPYDTVIGLNAKPYYPGLIRAAKYPSIHDIESKRS